MSALDDLIASDSAAAAPKTLDSLISADSAPAITALAPSAAPAQPNAPAGGWKAPGGLMMGIGDAVRGGAQDIVHGLSWAADKIAPDSQFAKDARAALPQMQQTIDQQNQQYSQGRQAQGADGIDWARLGGNVIGTAPTLAIGPEYSSLGLLGKIGLGATQGAAGAALMPTDTPQPDQSFAGQKAQQMGVGAALGGAGPLLAGAAGAAGRGLYNVAQPIVQPGKFVGRGLANTFAPQDAAAVADSLRNAPQFVPGSMPTTAQAGATPGLVATEKALANTNPNFKMALAQREADNNAARWGALNDVAQTPAALDAADAARQAAAGPLYDAANQQTTNVGKGFIQFAQRPAMQAAMQQADTLARNEGVQLKWPTPDDKAINGQALDYTSRALGDMIGAAKSSGNAQQARALTQAQGYLKNWTQAYIPEVKQAAQKYAEMSVPVNTMEAGQQISNAIGTRAMNATGLPQIQLAPYRTALTQAMKGQEYGIDPAALQSLQGVGQDLQRATISNSLRSPGSDTAYNLAANGWLAKQLFGPTFNGATGVGKGLAAGATALGGHPLAALGVFGTADKLGKMVGSKLQSHLSDYLLNPQGILPYLDARGSAAAAQAGPGPAMQGLLNYGRPAVINGLLGGFINAPNK